MIFGKTPFRVSFVGGGSDLRAFCQRHYGAVVSTSINKYIYIMIHPYFHDKIRINCSKLEDVSRVENIKHPLVRECLKRLRVKKGVEIASVADVSARSGLGSSSAFTVCLLHILHAYRGEKICNESLAEEAAKIEIDVLGEPIGKQDQYASSFGGLNFIRFDTDGGVHVEPLKLTPGKVEALEKNLLLFYAGRRGQASQILSKLQKNISKKEKYEKLIKMVDLAENMRISLKKNKIGEVGEILREGWLLKKDLAPSITNPVIEEYYERALKAGATGGKLLGAGGGGFLLFYCPPRHQNALRRALGLRELQFRFETDGSKIIYAGP